MNTGTPVNLAQMPNFRGGWPDSGNKASSGQLNLTGTGTGNELGKKANP